MEREKETKQRETQKQQQQKTHLSSLAFGSSWILTPSSVKNGPHHAKAPATNVTQVKARVDRIKLLLRDKREALQKKEDYVLYGSTDA